MFSVLEFTCQFINVPIGHLTIVSIIQENSNSNFKTVRERERDRGGAEEILLSLYPTEIFLGRLDLIRI